jgi:4-amino-4-deoxy-L-arabinose transferase-like glycosyltransferase
VKKLFSFCSQHWFLVSLASILGLAIFLRFFRLGNVPVALYWDEAAMLVDAKSLAKTGQDMHGQPWLQSIFLSYGDYKLPVYIWLASLSVKLFGVSRFALRLPSALAGLGSILVAVKLVPLLINSLTEPSRKKSKKIKFNSKTIKLIQLAVALVMAISPWSVMFSRTGFEGHLGQFFLSLAVLLLIMKPENLLFNLVAGLSAVLATYTYFSVRFVWPVILIAFIILRSIHLKKLKIKKLAFVQLLPLLIYGLMLWPMTQSQYYQASNQYRYSTSSILNDFDYAVASNVMREQSGNSFLSRILYHRHLLLIRQLLENYADHLSLNYLFFHGDSNLRHGTSIHGLMLWPLVVSFFVGLYYLFKKTWKLALFLLCWWLVALLPASVPEETPHALRSLNGLMPLIIIVGFGLGFAYKKLWLEKKKIWWLYLGLIFVSGFQFIYHYFKVYPVQSAQAWQDGYKNLVLTVVEKHQDVDKFYVDDSDLRIYLWMLAFGPYQPEQFQTWLADQQELSKIDNIIFENYNWNNLEALNQEIIISTHKNEAINRIRDGANPVGIDKVKGIAPQTEFWILKFNPNIQPAYQQK